MHTRTCTDTSTPTHLLPKDNDIRISKTGGLVDSATNAVLDPVINDNLTRHVRHAAELITELFCQAEVKLCLKALL